MVQFESACDAVIQTCTRRSVAEKGFSLTFDWTLALHYAVANRCGETFQQYFHILDEVRKSGRVTELPKTECQELLTEITWTCELLQAHRPMVVAVRFDPSWFKRDGVAFFADRVCFERYGGIPGMTHAELHVGSYGRYTQDGKELPSISDVPPSEIVTITDLEWTDALDALLDRVWSGRG